jgi:hypothetical protein
MKNESHDDDDDENDTKNEQTFKNLLTEHDMNLTPRNNGNDNGNYSYTNCQQKSLMVGNMHWID